MIVGSGMIARALRSPVTDLPGIVVHAAGVSNSRCVDPREFERERGLVEKTISDARAADCLVYFSTCSVEDPASIGTPYVSHKLAMEEQIRRHPRHLIMRLPQVAGRTPNPHTLLNYIYARIARGERFSIWSRARRNIIDSDDVRAIAVQLIVDGARAQTVNIACERDHGMVEIVETMRQAVKGHAVYDELDRGGAYGIDIERIRPLLGPAGVSFDGNYLERVLRKYYAPLG